jgi:hypothetical protein
MGLTLLYTLLLISRGAPEVLLDHEWRLDAVTLVGRSQILVRTLCKGEYIKVDVSDHRVAVFSRT